MLDHDVLRTTTVLLATLSLLAATVGGAITVASTYATTGDHHPAAPTGASYQALHASGNTGENVSVGIIDSTGFDTDQLGDDIAAARAFGPGKTLVNGGENDHGTAVAQTVGHIAPDSDRYLAAFDDERDFRAAVDWMARQDIDVVVIPTAFYGKPGDGSSWTTQAIQRLATDTVVIAAAGNTGDGDWRGPIDPTATTPVQPQDPATGDPVTLEVTSRRTQLWASWSNPERRYEIQLEQNGTTVATSDPYPADTEPNELLDTRLPAGSYDIIIEVQAATDPIESVLRLQTPTDRVHPTQPSGSLVSPATARGIIVTGALNQTTSQVPAYSSRGPTLDGRTGVDVVAPATPLGATVGSQEAGTSFAAARTAGIVALLLAAAPDASPGEIEHVLESSAHDIGPPGRDDASGHGVVRAGRAIAALRDTA